MTCDVLRSLLNVVIAIQLTTFSSGLYCTYVRRSALSGIIHAKVEQRDHARDVGRIWSGAMLGDAGGFEQSNLPSNNGLAAIKGSKHEHPSSHIVSVKSCNLAGMTNAEADCDIEINFGSEACFIAVTGENILQ